TLSTVMTVDNVIINTNIAGGKKKLENTAQIPIYRVVRKVVFAANRRRRGIQYQRFTGDNPLQEIFAF
ncbi:hypothetical protein SAMN05216584_102319, partial [Selenomonas sp. WCT3]|uniref:hypothetical protein n=1 Tax=Selenomonas sp. WCT3 TaxID=3158785 RepID=UPI000884A34A